MKPVRHLPHSQPRRLVTEVFHHVVCRHQVEVEIWPPRVELNFRDERSVNPINTQTRFEAIVYNATGGVTWEVLDLAGNPGAGSIDASGHYQAPDKGSLPSGFTDVVVATAAKDPLRKAFAWVTLVGDGPWPAPQPDIEIWPKKAYLYYPGNKLSTDRNEFIDASNTMQLFDARTRNSATSDVDWRVNGVPQANPALPSHLFLYRVTGDGDTGQVVTIRAEIQGQPAVHDEAKVVLLNYTWPKMRPVSDL